jgi:hypothetical protein
MSRSVFVNADDLAGGINVRLAYSASLAKGNRRPDERFRINCDGSKNNHVLQYFLDISRLSSCAGRRISQ